MNIVRYCDMPVMRPESQHPLPTRTGSGWNSPSLRWVQVASRFGRCLVFSQSQVHLPARCSLAFLGTPLCRKQEYTETC